MVGLTCLEPVVDTSFEPDTSIQVLIPRDIR